VVRKPTGTAATRVSVISDKSLVPISLVVGAIVFAISGTWWVASFKNDITTLTSEVRQLRADVGLRHADLRSEMMARIVSLEAAISQATVESVRSKEFDSWIRQFNSDNRAKDVVAPKRERD
jgi:hypothetical protein